MSTLPVPIQHEAQPADARVVARPHLLRPQELVQAHVQAGQSIREVLGGEWGHLEVTLNDRPVPRAAWADTRLRTGDVLFVSAVPQGTGNEGLRTLAIIAVALAAPGIAAAVAPGLGLSVGVVQAGITMAGMLAVNALIPPQIPKPEAVSQNRYTRLTGSANQANPFGVLPRLYGRFRFHPPLAANTYTEQVGADQYLRMLLCLGYGPLEIGGLEAGPGRAKLTQASGIAADAIKIGDTNIGAFEDVEYEIGTIDQITLYTQDITETQPNAALDLQATSGDDQWHTDNVVVTRTTAAATDEISLDIVFPFGFWSMGSDGKLNRGYDAPPADGIWETQPDTVEFRIEYAPTGSGTWTTVVDPLVVYGPKKDPFSISRRWRVTRGQYDVRVTRIRTYTRDFETHFHDAVWTALRSIQASQPWTNSDGAVMALRIKSTDQLSGIVDRLSVEATAILPAWNGSAWVETATRSPAWAYADALRGAQVQHPVPDSRLDLAELQAWDTWCAANGVYYDWVHDKDETVLERLRAIASTGRAAFGMHDTKFSVVRDVAGGTPVAAITPRNSWGFRGSRIFPDMPHAVKVRFVDPATWQQAERIVYDDGYDAGSATVFEVLETQGVTDAEQAWKEGRYHLAQLRLRPERFTVNQEVQHLRVTRGDVVDLSHDVILVGLGVGRIKSRTLNIGGETTAVVVDDRVTMEAGKTYAAKLWRADGTAVLQTVVTVAGTSSALTFTTPVAGLADGDLLQFGESGAETIECKVLEIQYHPDLTATLHLIPHAPAIYAADSGTIPAYDPGITLPPELQRPPAPIIRSIVSGEGTLVMQPSGVYAPGAAITWSMPPTAIDIDLAEVRWTTDGGSTWERRQIGPNENPVIIPAPEESDLEAQMRVRSIWQLWSEWSAAATLTVGTFTAQDVTDLSVAQALNTPQTPAQNLCTLTITVTPPAGDATWAAGALYYRAVGITSTYTRAGETDDADQVRMTVPMDGTTYELQIRSISTRGVESLDGYSEQFQVADSTGGVLLAAGNYIGIAKASWSDTTAGWFAGFDAGVPAWVVGDASEFIRFKQGVGTEFSGTITALDGSAFIAGTYPAGDYVLIDQDGITGVDAILGTTFRLPTDGSPPVFSSGRILEAEYQVYTSGVIKTADDPATDGGVLINNTGVKGYDINGDLTFHLDADTGIVTAFTANLTGGYLKRGADEILIDFANRRYTVGDETYGGPGEQTEYNGGFPRKYLGDGADKFLEFDSAAGIFVLGPGIDLIGAESFKSVSYYSVISGLMPSTWFANDGVSIGATPQVDNTPHFRLLSSSSSIIMSVRTKQTLNLHWDQPTSVSGLDLSSVDLTKRRFTGRIKITLPTTTGAGSSSYVTFGNGSCGATLDPAFTSGFGFQLVTTAADVSVVKLRPWSGNGIGVYYGTETTLTPAPASTYIIEFEAEVVEQYISGVTNGSVRFRFNGGSWDTINVAPRGADVAAAIRNFSVCSYITDIEDEAIVLIEVGRIKTLYEPW